MAKANGSTHKPIQGKAKRLVAPTTSCKAVSNGAELKSCHVTVVKCISRGNSRNLLEIGVQIGPALSHGDNLIVGKRRIRGTPYDGHRMHEFIKPSNMLIRSLGVKPEGVFANLGYRCVDK